MSDLHELLERFADDGEPRGATAVFADAVSVAVRRRRRRRGQAVGATLIVAVLVTGGVAAIASTQHGVGVRTIAGSGPSATAANHEPYLGIPSVVGRIVAVSPGNFEKTITLDQGTGRGIRAGMTVVASDGGLVGRVVQVWTRGCNVLLLDDPTFAVGVRVVNGRATGIAQGQVGLSTLSLTLSGPLAPSTRPRKHDLAETSGLQGSTFPPGIPVGTVDTVTVSGDGLSINVRLVPLVRVGALKYVKVVLWSTPASQPASAQSVDAAASALPPGTTIQQSQSVMTQTADYDRIVGLAPDGSTYDINVFRKFSASELDGAGLAKTSVPGGTIWVGSDRPDQRSLYFLSSTGAAVWLANSSRSGHAASLSGLEQTATRLAALVPIASAP
jgi:hypothetical protein